MAVRVRRTQHERAPAHNLSFCEHPGCRARFYISGRHHCRECGASVCSAHFVRPRCQKCHSEMPELPTPTAAPATEGGLPGDEEASGEGEQVPRGLVDLHMCKDVYATSFVLANNATPDMYSFLPWKNRAMWRAWLYLGFIASSQLFVLYALLCLFPIVVKSQSFFVDCDHPSAEVVAALEPPPRLTAARYLLHLVTGEAAADAREAQLDPRDRGGDWRDASWGEADREARPSASAAGFSPAMRAHCLAQRVALEAYASDGQGG